MGAGGSLRRASTRDVTADLFGLIGRTLMPQQIRAVVVDPAAAGKLAIKPVELRDSDREQVAVETGVKQGTAILLALVHAEGWIWSSNPVPSSGESATNRAAVGDLRAPMRRHPAWRGAARVRLISILIGGVAASASIAFSNDRGCSDTGSARPRRADSPSATGPVTARPSVSVVRDRAA